MAVTRSLWHELSGHIDLIPDAYVLDQFSDLYFPGDMRAEDPSVAPFCTTTASHLGA